MNHIEREIRSLMSFVSAYDNPCLPEEAHFEMIESGCRQYINLHAHKGVSIFAADSTSLACYYLAHKEN